MDSDNISFRNLNIRQKLVSEQLENLIRVGNENKSNILLNDPLQQKEVKELFFKNFKELSEEDKQQQTNYLALLKEQNECSKHISGINTKIGATEETLRMLKAEKSLGKDEIKKMKKTLNRAIKKYSTKFNFDVEVTKIENETFVASVKFLSKNDANTVDFLINRKDRKIVDFTAEPLLSNTKIEELKNEVLGENGLNIKLLLSRLKDIL